MPIQHRDTTSCGDLFEHWKSPLISTRTLRGNRIRRVMLFGLVFVRHPVKNWCGVGTEDRVRSKRSRKTYAFGSNFARCASSGLLSKEILKNGLVLLT